MIGRLSMARPASVPSIRYIYNTTTKALGRRRCDIILLTRGVTDDRYFGVKSRAITGATRAQPEQHKLRRAARPWRSIARVTKPPPPRRKAVTATASMIRFPSPPPPSRDGRSPRPRSWPYMNIHSMPLCVGTSHNVRTYIIYYNMHLLLMVFFLFYLFHDFSIRSIL